MSTTLEQALAAMQQLQKTLVEATEKLQAHNSDEESHPILLEKLQEILNSDKLYTNEQILALVKSVTDEHFNSPFETAHDGWEAKETEIFEAIAAVNARVDEIISRFDLDTEPNTDLEKIIAEIEAKYAPILDNLQKSFTEAVAMNNNELAEIYKNAMTQTLDEKKAEIQKAVEDYQNSQTGGSSTGPVPEPEPDGGDEDIGGSGGETEDGGEEVSPPPTEEE